MLSAIIKLFEIFANALFLLAFFEVQIQNTFDFHFRLDTAKSVTASTICVSADTQIFDHVDLYKGIDVIINLIHCVVHEKLYSLLSKVYNYVDNNGHANQYYYNMAADCQYLSEEAVESDPSIYVYNGPKEDAHELVVVGDKDEVLVRHCYTGG